MMRVYMLIKNNFPFSHSCSGSSEPIYLGLYCSQRMQTQHR